MVKAYDFSMNSQPAEFSNGFVSVTYGLSRQVDRKSADFSGTLAQGLEALEKFRDVCVAPCVIFLQMKYRNDRKPAGFDAAKKRLEKPA